MSESKNLITTFIAKSIGLVASFMLVMISTKIWGTTGRGYISLITADASILCVLTNLFAGGAFMYHINKIGVKKLFPFAIIWICCISLIGSFFIAWNQEVEWALVFAFTIAISLSSLLNNYLLNQLRFGLVNLLTVAYNLLFVVSTGYLLYWEVSVNWTAYFWLNTVFLLAMSVIPLIQLLKETNIQFEFLSKRDVWAMFQYGWKNELSYFLQFLSYRVSYFFIFYYIGVKSLGIFGILVLIGESIWVISRSIATVQYATLLNTESEEESRIKTNRYALYSLCVTLVAIGFVFLIPESLIIELLNKDFAGFLSYFSVLAPGVLAIGVSTVFGHYFSARNKQWILVIKSFFGFIAALILTPVFIHYYGLWGAALAMSLSYCISSVILSWAYFSKRFRTNEK